VFSVNKRGRAAGFLGLGNGGGSRLNKYNIKRAERFKFLVFSKSFSAGIGWENKKTF